jgi:hypothetical protein
MQKPNPIAEDKFEEARQAFFGVATETSPNAAASESLKMRNDTEDPGSVTTQTFPQSPGIVQPSPHLKISEYMDVPTVRGVGGSK